VQDVIEKETSSSASGVTAFSGIVSDHSTQAAKETCKPHSSEMLVQY